jgi:DNA repair protein RecN (Recombination protein N)
MSWLRLAVRDFVIVEHVELDLAPGFTALTGETGAGKSILIDALQLLLGGRADAQVVREGATRADVAGEFDAPPDAAAWLAEHGFDGPPGEPVLLRRTVDQQGRSRGWINGSPATAAQLRELGACLVDIHGQHAWQSLTRPESVRALLDRYGRIDTAPVRAAWQAWRAALEALENAQAQQAAREQERERLQWQVDEVARLQPGEHEWDELNRQHARLAHAQALIDAARSALTALDEDEPSATTLLHRAVQVLSGQQAIEPRYATFVSTLQQALAQIEDVCHDLQHHARDAEVDPDALAALDERMSRWVALARRYRCAPAELPARWQAWQRRLRELDEQTDLDALRQQVERAYRAYRTAAEALSAQRAPAAERLSAAITEAMQGLGMAGGRFEVQLQALPEPQAHGLERVEFLVAAHPGVTPRPVARVASGGELSRIALAIAVVTSQLGDAPTLIFDEVDSGIGGAVAHTVGQLLRRLGQDRQVLAVTHLAQVAACAHQHLRVSKVRRANRTLSQVTPLDDEMRVAELARMLGGSTSAASLAHARELLQP